MKEELINLLECLPDEIFWLWSSRWYDEYTTCIDYMNDKQVAEEIEYIKELIK